MPEPLAASVSATSLSAMSGSLHQQQLQQQQHQPTLPKFQAINLCQKVSSSSSRNLEELNLFFDENNDLCERTTGGSGLLLIDDVGGRVLTKSPEVSDHIQFLITEVPAEDSDTNGDGASKDKDEKETTDDCDLVAIGEPNLMLIFVRVTEFYCPTNPPDFYFRSPNIIDDLLSHFSISFAVWS